jgi:hypothetical protein
VHGAVCFCSSRKVGEKKLLNICVNVDRSVAFTKGSWYGLVTRTGATTRGGLPIFQKSSSIWSCFLMALLVMISIQKTLQ